MTERSIAIIGAGGWGTALASSASSSGHRVRLWCREESVRDQILTHRENQLFLEGITLPDAIQATSSLAEALLDAEVVVFAVPSRYLGASVASVEALVPPEAIVACASKGIETGSLRRMSEVLSCLRPDGSTVVLSGPSFAREVARGQPTAIVAASRHPPAAESIKRTFSREAFQIFVSSDVVGVELGGALKNVIAIAAGMAQGVGLGTNAGAALMTRGLMEISELAQAMGGRRETLLGLAGMGDLVLTCTGKLSRNRGVGVRLGQGESIEAILESMQMVAEGVETTRAANSLARRHGVELALARTVQRVIDGEQNAEAAMRSLFVS